MVPVTGPARLEQTSITLIPVSGMVNHPPVAPPKPDPARLMVYCNRLPFDYSAAMGIARFALAPRTSRPGNSFVASPFL